MRRSKTWYTLHLWWPLSPLLALLTSGGQAAQDVRRSETRYTRTIEETIVFASSRKLLALGSMFDKRLISQSEDVVEVCDVM